MLALRQTDTRDEREKRQGGGFEKSTDTAESKVTTPCARPNSCQRQWKTGLLSKRGVVGQIHQLSRLKELASIVLGSTQESHPVLSHVLSQDSLLALPFQALDSLATFLLFIFSCSGLLLVCVVLLCFIISMLVCFLR